MKATLGLLILITSSAFCQQVATVELVAYPDMAVADGNSTLSVSATVRDRNGNYVPDGTQVAFTVSSGQFNDSVVGTQGGVARASLVAPNIPGKSKITASVVSYAGVADITVEFVSDPSQIRRTTSYVEVTGKTYLAYAVDQQTIAATGSGQTAHVTYRNVNVYADDLQLELGPMVLIAYNAKLQVGSGEIQAAQLHYNIRDKIGTAVITEDGKDVMVQLDGVEAKHLERTQDPEVYRDEYRFMELTNSTTQILANSIIVNPGREVLFTHAKVYVGANKLMSMPFYSLDMLRQGGIFNDQMFGVNQDGVSLDLPYYVSLGPRQSSSLRLRSQYTGGRTYTSSRGTTLDWVTKYSDNDAYSGDFTINDLSSDHFGATIRHTQNFSKNLHGYFLLDSPRHESLYGYANLSHEFSNYRASFSMSGSRGLTRTTSNDRRADFSIDTNAKKLFGGLISHSIGVTTSYHQYDGSSAPIVQQGYGLRYRVRTAQARFGFGSVGAGLTMTKLWGSNQVSGVGLIGNISSAMTITPTATMTVNYEYNQGQSGPGIFGRQRISTGLLGEFGSFSTSAYLSRSLDENFVTLFLDNSIQLSKTWRIAYSYTGDSALGSSFKDYSFVIGFRIGIREIGLRWSYLTNRIGFELLSAGF